MCGFDRTRSGVSGSSSTSCTAARCASQAPAGSSSTLGPGGSLMPAPAARKLGNHSTRWRTTSRAVQPLTGAGASQSVAPRTRSLNVPAIWRCRCAGRSDSAIGQQPVELGVTLVDADLHAAGEPRVAALEAVGQRGRVQPGAAVAEVLEPQRLQGDAGRVALVGERLHEPVLAHLGEAAVEAVLLT